MKKLTNLNYPLLLTAMIFLFVLQSCNQNSKEEKKEIEKEIVVEESEPEKAEYFLLRPEIEKAYGYSHAVKIGNHIKISGAVSIDDEGNTKDAGDIEQQMKNCYSDLQKVLEHYGYSFDDVVAENIFVTDMAKFMEFASFRNTIYQNHYPTGTWLEVKGLALPGLMVEIEMEAYKAE